MRQFQTSTLEQRKVFNESFQTHPLEVAWASEAIFFIDVERISEPLGTLVLRVQLSVDGVNWLDEGTAFGPIAEKAVDFRRVTHFGGWLRLVGMLEGNACEFKATIHLVVKE